MIVVLTLSSLSSLQTTNIIIILQFSKSNLQKLSTPPPAWQKARMVPIARMAKKTLSGWQKSCQPPSGIGARFATTEALASPRSNPAGIPSNSVAAPKSKPSTPSVAAPKPQPPISYPLPQISAVILFSSKHISLVRGIRWF